MGLDLSCPFRTKRYCVMKRIIVIGGGDMKEKTTIEIDRYVASLAKEHAGDKRAYGLFIGTASHDFMPAFNTFRKTYTSVFDIKADCLLTVYVDTPKERIDEKFSKADFIYIGGGDTGFMLQKWRETGLIDKILEAYERGVTIVGRSAGAVCWFDTMYTDSELLNGNEEDYRLYNGLGVLKGTMCPHYNVRTKDFDKAIIDNNITSSYAVEDDCALEFIDGNFTKSISSGKKAYNILLKDGQIIKNEL